MQGFLDFSFRSFFACARLGRNVAAFPPLCFPRLRNGAAGLRARHDLVPLSEMTWGVVFTGLGGVRRRR